MACGHPGSITGSLGGQCDRPLRRSKKSIKEMEKCYCVQRLLNDHNVDDAVYNAAFEQLGQTGLIELTVLLGHYSNVALTLIAHRVSLPTQGRLRHLSAEPTAAVKARSRKRDQDTIDGVLSLALRNFTLRERRALALQEMPIWPLSRPRFWR